MVFFYVSHGANMAEKFPNFVNVELSMVIGLIWTIVFTIIFVVALGEIGTSSILESAKTGACFGAEIWSYLILRWLQCSKSLVLILLQLMFWSVLSEREHPVRSLYDHLIVLIKIIFKLIKIPRLWAFCYHRIRNHIKNNL